MSDEEEVLSNIAKKFPSEDDFEAKFDALERAENAYFQAKGPPKQQVIQMPPFYGPFLLRDKDELYRTHVFEFGKTVFSL